MDIALYQLRTFWEVARAESITQASRRLGYSQSTVTSHIRALESQTGTPLFQRLPHGVRMTDAGETFHNYVARLFSLVDELSSALSIQGETVGRASVGVVSYLVDQEMTQLIWECQYRYPKVEVSPMTMYSSRIPEEIAAGKLDLGLVVARADVPMDLPPGLLYQDVQELELVPVASPALLASGDIVSALRSARTLSVDSGCPSHRLLREAVEAAYGVSLECTLAGSVRGVIELMRSGLFLSMLPETAVSREIEHGDIVVLRDLPGQHRVVRVIWSEQSWLPPAVAAVLEVARRGTSPSAGGRRRPMPVGG